MKNRKENMEAKTETMNGRIGVAEEVMETPRVASFA